MNADKRGAPLHVLVVDEDPSVLRTVCGRLLAHGYEVSTCRQAHGLHHVISRLQPSLIIIDVLMPDLNAGELRSLLARYPAGGTPAMILHSVVPVRALRRMVDVRDALGVVKKTTDDVEFFMAFNGMVDRFLSGAVGLEGRPEPAMSGTHRIADDTDQLAPENIALWTGGTRS